MWHTIAGMELTPDLLLEAKFSPARRGYDMAEVDDFLERCAEGLDVLLARLRTEFDRAERAEAELSAARATGFDVATAPPDDAWVAEPEPEPEFELEPEVGGEAESPAPSPVRVGEPMRILIAAERTAEAAIADAKAEAERIRREAESVASTQRSEAETLLHRARAEAEAEAQRAGDEARRAIQDEVMTLRRDRDALTDDIRVLRTWLDEQRGHMRTTAAQLQRLVDDPAALREVAAPELSADPASTTADDADADVVVDVADEQAGWADEGADDGAPTEAVPAFGAVPFDHQGSDADVSNDQLL